MIAPQDLAEDLRTRINPAYATQMGTESHERRLCAEAIEGLIAENEKLREALRMCRKSPCFSYGDIRHGLDLLQKDIILST